MEVRTNIVSTNCKAFYYNYCTTNSANFLSLRRRFHVSGVLCMLVFDGFFSRHRAHLDRRSCSQTSSRGIPVQSSISKIGTGRLDQSLSDLNPSQGVVRVLLIGQCGRMGDSSNCRQLSPATVTYILYQRYSKISPRPCSQDQALEALLIDQRNRIVKEMCSTGNGAKLPIVDITPEKKNLSMAFTMPQLAICIEAILSFRSFSKHRLNSMFWVPAKCASKINLETG